MQRWRARWAGGVLAVGAGRRDMVSPGDELMRDKHNMTGQAGRGGRRIGWPALSYIMAVVVLLPTVSFLYIVRHYTVDRLVAFCSCVCCCYFE